MKSYKCGDLTVCELGAHEPYHPKLMKLPDNYHDILEAKKRLLNLVKNCECGEIGTPCFVKTRAGSTHACGYVEYPDYTIGKILCRSCNEKYMYYEDSVYFNNKCYSK